MSKNLLLGYGEQLTSPMPRPPSNGNKVHPYSYEENKPFVLQKITSVIEKSERLPKQALANGKIVIKLVLHPAYLAKSYYPESLLKRFELVDIGSKATSISPRKVTTTTRKDTYLTSCIYVAGSISQMESLCEHITIDALNKGQQSDVSKIEDIDLYAANEKIKSINLNENLTKYEVVIHTPEGEQKEKLLKDFAIFSQACGATVSINNAISTGGVTFLSLISGEKSLKKVAEYTYLRVLRIMPDLRFHKPVVTRNVMANSEVSLPNEPAQNSNIKVAVFDGGVGVNDIEKWCTETVFGETPSTTSDFLTHGSEVTSCLLFGDVEPDQKVLQTPYANVDHFRVVDPTIDSADFDLLDVLKRIIDVLDKNKYDFINLSLGPRLPIDDDEIHAWTSALEPYLSDGKTLMTVAVGNDGDLDGQDRIQTPADLVNALAVGAASAKDDIFWSKASYSSRGPGRSPGIVKPDIVAFGGDTNNPVLVYSPLSGKVVETAGTSFAAPLALRMAIALKTTLKYDVSPLMAKALLIHKSQNNNLHLHDVGWGKIPSDLDGILYTGDNEVTVIYRNNVAAGAFIRTQIPFPDLDIQGRIHIKATFCYATDVDPEHPLHYTRSGLVVTFRPKGIENETSSFFSDGKLYADETDLRSGAYKWDNTLHQELEFKQKDLTSPCFEINHQAREGGKKADNASSLPFILILTVRAENTPELYNAILQKYQVLQPIQTVIDVPIRTGRI